MGRILAKIQKKVGKWYCFVYSALFFIFAFAFISMISFSVWDTSHKGIFAFAFFFSLICGIFLLAVGLYDPGTDESAVKPPRFYTLNEDGDIVLTEVSTPPPLDLKETRRADGKVDISLEIHSKEQAVEVLAALAVMYDKGDLADTDYKRSVHKIREHFNL